MSTANETQDIRREQDKHHTIRSVSVGTVWRVLRYPFIALSVAIIPRTMGDEVYGRYAYFMSVFLILDYLTDIGVTQVFGRFVPECETKGDSRQSAHLLHGFLRYAMLLTMAIVVILLCIPAVRPMAGFPLEWFVVMGALLLWTKFEGILFAFIYGLNHIARYSSKEVMRSAFTFTFVLCLYLLFGLQGAFWGLVANEVVLSLVAMTWTKSYLARRTGPVRIAAFKPYLFFGLKFYLPLFLFGTMQRCGNVLIQWLRHSPQEVGYFDVANQFLLLTATFLGLIVTTLLPSLTPLYVRGRADEVHRNHRVIMTYCGVAVFFAYNTLGWLGRDVITLLLGPDFAPVHGNAMVMVLAIFPGLISYVGMNYAILQKEPGVYLKAVLAGLVVMIAGCLLLVPAWGPFGASWASVAAYAALTLVFAVKYRRAFGIVLRDFRWVVLLGAPFALLYRFPVSLPVAVLLWIGTTIAYVAILAACRLIRWRDARSVIVAFKAGRSKSAG